jgi:hypothetical protein
VTSLQNLASGNGLLGFNPPASSGFNALIDPATLTTRVSQGSNDINVTSNNTGANAPGGAGAKDLTTVPPLIVCNYMIRII